MHPIPPSYEIMRSGSGREARKLSDATLTAFRHGRWNVLFANRSDPRLGFSVRRIPARYDVYAWDVSLGFAGRTKKSRALRPRSSANTARVRAPITKLGA